MAADVLAGRQQAALGIEEAGGVDASSGAKADWLFRSLRGRPWITFAERRGKPGKFGWRLITRTAAIERLPHAPQLEETNEWRSSLAASRATPGRSFASAAFTPARLMLSMSAAPAMIPSVKRNPAARSTSFPGVRIVTATEVGGQSAACSARRISSGSSTASSSDEGTQRGAGYSPHFDARDARPVADLNHDSDSGGRSQQ